MQKPTSIVFDSRHAVSIRCGPQAGLRERLRGGYAAMVAVTGES